MAPHDVARKWGVPPRYGDGYLWVRLSTLSSGSGAAIWLDWGTVRNMGHVAHVLSRYLAHARPQLRPPLVLAQNETSPANTT